MEEEKTHKPGLGGVKEATERHILRGREGLRKKRGQKMEKRRFSQPQEGAKGPLLGLRERILGLAPSLQGPADVRELSELLRMGNEVEPYYGPHSEIHFDAVQGPWIFPEGSPKIRQLLDLLGSTKDIPLLMDVLACLICISAHDERRTWTNRIEGAVEPCLQMLPHVPPALQENVIWLFANMCMDSLEMRNRIVREARLIAFMMDFNHSVVTFLFRTFFRDSPYPFEPKEVAPLWARLSSRLFVEAPADYNDELLFAAHLMMRDERFSAALIRDEVFVRKILSNLERLDCVKILVAFAEHAENHTLLLGLGVLDRFLELLNHMKPAMRLEGGAGLCYLSTSAEALVPLCSQRALSLLEMQLDCSDRFDVQLQVYWTLVNVLETAHRSRQGHEVFPLLVEHNIVRYLSSMLHVPGTINLLVAAIKCIFYLSQWERKLVKNLLEEQGALAVLCDLQTHPSREVSDWAIKCF